MKRKTEKSNRFLKMDKNKCPILDFPFDFLENTFFYAPYHNFININY
jgi:hypothetical protein